MTEQQEFKALTHIHLPFTERSYAPGDPISRSEFEAEEEKARAIAPAPTEEFGGHTPTAQEQIDYFLEWGTIGGPDDRVHPDHIPADPGQPSVELMVHQARTLVETYEANGWEVPAELRQLADADYQHVTVAENGRSGDHVG